MALILYARSHLVSAGDVHILINGEKTITGRPAGGKLLQTLSEAKLFSPPPAAVAAPAPSASVIIHEGGGSMLPTEEAHFNRREAAEGLAPELPDRRSSRI